MRQSKKLWDQIFELKYLCKQLAQQSKKCEQEERAQKTKAKTALEKGNMEGARIHAENSIRKKNEALQYLKMSSQLDAVISRLDQQNSLAQVNKSAAGITKNINSLLKTVPMDKMQTNMESFQKALEDLDVATVAMDTSMSKQTTTNDADAVNEMLQELSDANKMEMKITAPGVTNRAVATQNAEQDGSEIFDRLNQIRGS